MLRISKQASVHLGKMINLHKYFYDLPRQQQQQKPKNQKQKQQKKLLAGQLPVLCNQPTTVWAPFLPRAAASGSVALRLYRRLWPQKGTSSSNCKYNWSKACLGVINLLKTSFVFSWQQMTAATNRTCATCDSISQFSKLQMPMNPWPGNQLPKQEAKFWQVQQVFAAVSGSNILISKSPFTYP